ncbi:MAG: DUF523 domain-containing protein [Colwellia sp.]
MFDKVLISRCLLGEKVRYNNEAIPLGHPLLLLWQKQQRLVLICPEVSGGLPIPRSPAEIQPNTGEVITFSGINVSKQFKQGAQMALNLCQQHNIRFALMKESSPSCGSTVVYDGSFSNNKVLGQGLTSLLLQQHNIKVFSEESIDQLAALLDK